MTGLIEKTSFLPFAGFSSHAKQVCSASQPSVTQQKDHGRTFTSLTLAYPPPPSIQHPTGGGVVTGVCMCVGQLGDGHGVSSPQRKCFWKKGHLG